MPRDFDRKTASPTESAVMLDQAIREHSGAGILNPYLPGRSVVDCKDVCATGGISWPWAAVGIPG